MLVVKTVLIRSENIGDIFCISTIGGGKREREREREIDREREREREIYCVCVFAYN